MEKLKSTESQEKEIAKARIIALEEEFQKISNLKLSDSEFNTARWPIDKELNSIYIKFPDLEEWNDNRP